MKISQSNPSAPLLVYVKMVGWTNKRDRKGIWEKGGKAIKIPKAITERGRYK